MSQNIFHNTGRTGSFIENLDKGGELTSFEAEKMLKIVRHMATKRTQLNPNRLGSLWVGCLRLYSGKVKSVSKEATPLRPIKFCLARYLA